MPAALLLELHLAFCVQRRLNADYNFDFLGRFRSITPAARKNIPIVHHPGQRFWGIPHTPDSHHPVWPDVLASFSLRSNPKPAF